MKLYRLHRAQTLPLSLDEAWRFFSSPHNLSSITPPWLNLTILGDIPDHMFPGMLIHYRLTPISGLPLTWVSEITHVDQPYYFVDEQRFGPYRFWHHQHHFTALENGVEVSDVVSYAMKFGPIGTLLHTLLVYNRLEKIFWFRQNALNRLFLRSGLNS